MIRYEGSTMLVTFIIKKRWLFSSIIESLISSLKKNRVFIVTACKKLYNSEERYHFSAKLCVI